MIKKQLSIHRSSKKEYNIDFFGHYLAGLIDGDGHISTIGHIVISFNIKEIKSACKLRSLIGYGCVRKVKGKNACNFIISNKKGIIKTALLVKDKLKHPTKILQYNMRLSPLFEIEKTIDNSIINWDTPWFTGFFEADGHFKIHFINRANRLNTEVRLLAQIDQKNYTLLTQIQQKFGGYLGFRKSQDTFYYSSVSFANIYSILSFFDKHSLQSDRAYLRYILLRKAYLQVQQNKHLQIAGLKKIQKYHRKLADMI